MTIEGSFIGTEKASGRLTVDHNSYVYQVQLGDFSSLDLTLSGLSASASIRVFRDSNSNGKLDAGEFQIPRSSELFPNSSYISGHYEINQAGSYLIEVNRNPSSTEDPDFIDYAFPRFPYGGDTNYFLTAYTDGYYYFTHQYGDGEYYKGIGRVSPSEGTSLRSGQVIKDGFLNEAGLSGYTVIDSVANSRNTAERGEVKVYQYYDANYINDNGTQGALVDNTPNGGSLGHLHPYPYTSLTDSDYQTTYLGLGKRDLGSEGGLLHLDGHRFGFPTEGDAVFSRYYQGDLQTHSHA